MNVTGLHLTLITFLQLFMGLTVSFLFVPSGVYMEWKRPLISIPLEVVGCLLCLSGLLIYGALLQINWKPIHCKSYNADCNTIQINRNQVWNEGSVIAAPFSFQKSLPFPLLFLSGRHIIELLCPLLQLKSILLSATCLPEYHSRIKTPQNVVLLCRQHNSRRLFLVSRIIVHQE